MRNRVLLVPRAARQAQPYYFHEDFVTSCASGRTAEIQRYLETTGAQTINEIFLRFLYTDKNWFTVFDVQTVIRVCFEVALGTTDSHFAFNDLQACFNPQGTRILTASSDKTARLWEPTTGECIQVRNQFSFTYSRLPTYSTHFLFHKYHECVEQGPTTAVC